ncbi:MAG: hypothetical protein ABR585_14700, partial [Gemmatimonadaceae bacterium]
YYQFTSHANGGTYGPAVGQIWLSKLGQSSITHPYGKIYRNGILVGAGDVSLRFWEYSAAGSSTGGQALQSFAVPGTNANGVYNAGALYADGYRVYVIDNEAHAKLV